MAGNAYGRVIGVIGGSLGAIGAPLSIGGAYPWWSLGIFVLCVYVVHGILVFDEDERAATSLIRGDGAPPGGPDPRGALVPDPLAGRIEAIDRARRHLSVANGPSCWIR